MELTTELLTWTSDDEAAWQKFLSSQPGSRLIPKLLESAPELLSGGDSNSILIRSGELRGWRAVVQTLVNLSHSQPKGQEQTQTDYPAPENDAAWNDGQKIIEQNT